MNFPEKLQILRKSRGMTQEEMASRLNVSRQAVAKWEAGQALPDLANVVALSEMLNVTTDHLLKEQACALTPEAGPEADLARLVAFRIEAGCNTYAASMNEVPPARPDAHDYRYARGQYVYRDTYLGGERFAGQEAIWQSGKAVYAMNYAGRVLDERFSGNFLKEALRAANPQMPFRGPAIYQAGEYLYRAKVIGDVRWFQGEEEIYCNDIRVYEGCFHGGLI